MPVLGVGVDIVGISRVRQACERTGEVFLRKVFTDRESEYCRRYDDPWSHLAGRFAAKESVIKAIGRRLNPVDIEITTDTQGRPGVELRGEAVVVAREVGAGRILVSISHTGDLAVAVAVISGL